MRSFALFFVFFTILTGCSSLSSKKTHDDSQKDWTVADAIMEIKRNDLKLGQAAPEVKSFIYQDYFFKGNSAYLSNDFELGNVYFQKLSEVHPEDLFIKQKYAVGLIRAGNFELAKENLYFIFNKDPKQYIKVGIVLGGVLSGLKLNQEARVVYQRILKHDPKEHDACLFLAKSYLTDKSVSKAKKILRDCGKKNPKEALYPFYLGKIELTLDRKKQAETFFKKSYELDPTYSEALNSYVGLLEERKLVDKVIRLLKDHLFKYESDELILSTLVEKLFYYEKFKEVLPYAEKLSDLNPDDLNLKVKLGILYSDVKNYDLAISTFNEILTVVPDSDKVLYYLAAIYQEVDELDKSIETYTKIKSDSSLYQESLFQVATILERFALDELKEENNSREQGEEFVSFIQKHFTLQKDLQVRFSVQLAGYFENIKEYSKATNWMEKVLAHEKMTQSHLFYYASLLEKQQHFDKAYDVMKGILAQEPNNAHAFNFLGYSLLEREIQKDQAHAYISKAMELAPDDGYILDSMGWYYFKMGSFNKAYDLLKKAFDQVPSDPTIAKHLVLSYMKLHDDKKVEQFLGQLFDRSPGLFESQEFIDILKEHRIKHRFPASK